MTMPRNRAEAIVSCFESKTRCKWSTEDHDWELKPCGNTMLLTCANTFENLKLIWQVDSVYLGYHGRLNIEADEGIILGFEIGE